MASEILAVPEEHLADVIRVIRAGLDVYGFEPEYLHPDVVEQLKKWCDEEEEYLKELASE